MFAKKLIKFFPLFCILFFFFSPSLVLATNPSCSSLNLSSNEIKLGQSIKVSTSFYSYGILRYARVSSIGQRCSDSPYGCNNLASGNGSIAKTFIPDHTGYWVFETNAYESADCRLLCSGGAVLWENNCSIPSCTGAGCFTTIGGCTSNCRKWLTVNCAGTDTSCGAYPNCKNCNSKDGWYDYGAPYLCCGGKYKYTCQDQKKRDYYCSGTSCSYNIVNTRTVKTNPVYCPNGCLDGACLDKCVDVSYSTVPATIYEGDSFKVIADTAGATSCQGNWSNVGRKLDGIYTPGYYNHWGKKYSWLYSDGLPSGRHDFKMTVNGGSCVCNNFRFWVKTPVCTPAAAPSLTVLNQHQFENPIDFQWTSAGNQCTEYQSQGATKYLTGTSGIEVETAPGDVFSNITAKIRGKNFLNPTTCQTCTTNNGTDCCLSDWVSQTRCNICKAPSSVSTQHLTCSDGKGNFTGTKITWSDQSNYEDGFAIYRSGAFVADTARNVESYNDCRRGVGYSSDYKVRCFTEYCDESGPREPTCPCDEPWQNIACNGDSCTSSQMYQVQYCYLTYWDGSKGELCDTNYQCADDPNCLQAWFQTQEGDVHAQTDIGSAIPDTVPPTQKYFSLDGLGGFPGLVSYNGTTASFGSAAVSSSNWLAKTSLALTYSYDYFNQLLHQPDQVAGGVINNGDLPGGEGGVVSYNSDVQTGSTWTIGSKKIVVLVNGKFLIKNKITIASGGSLVVVAKGGIGVSSLLQITGESNNLLEGIFITDGKFYSSVDPAAFPSLNSVVSDKRLVIDGSVAAAGGVDLARDLGSSANQTTPAELFRFSPALVINSYSGLWQLNFTWEELAP